MRRARMDSGCWGWVMSEILQLNTFFLQKIGIESLPPATDPERIGRGALTISFELGRDADDPNRFILALKVNCQHHRPNGQPGLAVDAEIHGEFFCPDSVAPEQKEQLVAINGGIILYGILRGQLTAYTGPFPGGVFNLPTVNMVEALGDFLKQKG